MEQIAFVRSGVGVLSWGEGVKTKETINELLTKVPRMTAIGRFDRL